MEILDRYKIKRWEKGFPIEDKISFLLLFIYLISLSFIWILPNYIKLIIVNPFNIPIETVIGWIITLVAIVPTLTLMVAQLASGAYTYKIISLYRKEPYFWILLTILLLIILMGFIIKIFNISDGRIFLTFHSSALFGILFLIPYLSNTLISIGFKANVDRLINHVKREKLIPLLFEDKTSLNPDIRDPSFNVISILEKAIQENDLQAFGYIFNKFMISYEEILQDIIKKPIKFNPRSGPTYWDSLIGTESSQRLWTSSTIRNLVELWFSHIQTIQRSASKNESLLIEFSSIISQFSLNSYNNLQLLNDEIIDDVFGQKIRYILSSIAKEGIKTKQLDSVAQCIDSLADQGCYGAKNKIGSNIINVASFSKNDLEIIRKNFISYKEWDYSEQSFIMGRLLNAHRKILIDQIIYQSQAIHQNDFKEPMEISKLILIQNLPFGVQANLEAILVPILLQYYGNGKEENLRDIAMAIHDVFPFNQDLNYQLFNVIFNRYSEKNNLYQHQILKDWLDSIIKNLDSILHAIITLGKGNPNDILQILEDLTIVAFKMQDYDLVLDLIKRYFRAHHALLKINTNHLNDPFNLSVCIIYSCFLNKKDDFAINLIQEMFLYGKSSSKTASSVAFHFTNLGSFAEYFGRNQVTDFIIDQLIKLEEIYPNDKLGSLETSAKLCGFLHPTYPFTTPYFDDMDRSPIIYRLTKLLQIDNPPKKFAYEFMKNLSLHFITLAQKRVNVLKNTSIFNP